MTDSAVEKQNIDLLSLDFDELSALVLSIGEPKYRTEQLFSGLHRGLSPREMTNVGKKVAEKLDAVSVCHFPEIS